MARFIIDIIHTYKDIFDIEADIQEEAERIAKNKQIAGDFPYTRQSSTKVESMKTTHSFAHYRHNIRGFGECLGKDCSHPACNWREGRDSGYDIG
jgi:hypothetical protein